MPTYYAECFTCQKKLVRKLKKEKREQTKQEYEELVLFETSHSLKATSEQIAEAMICPRCDGVDCSKVYYNYEILGYVRGSGYLDKSGCHRDMHLHKLTTDDPYSEMRVAGEVDDLKERLKRGGQRKSNKKHYAPTSEMMKAVKKSVNTPDSSAG